jgi:hypothetical protein
MVGSCGHGNEPSDSIKGGEFLDQWSDYQMPTNGSVPGSVCNVFNDFVICRGDRC